MDLKNKDYTLVVLASLEHDGISYDKDARTSYLIHEMSFHFNQLTSDFSYQYIEDKNSVEITVHTDYARVMYIVSMLDKAKRPSKEKEVHDSHHLSINWKDVEEQFYNRGMVYMMAGYCPINDKHYLNKERETSN